MTTNKQQTKLDMLTDLSTVLHTIVDNQIDMYRDDISSISDAYKCYEVETDVKFLQKFLDNDEQLIDALRGHIARNGWSK